MGFNLFNDKHLMVEKLLKFLIGQINAQLLIGVFLNRDRLFCVRKTCLFENEHGVVKQLLQLLIRIVDAQLFKVVHL